jgi:hypothetical protein
MVSFWGVEFGKFWVIIGKEAPSSSRESTRSVRDFILLFSHSFAFGMVLAYRFWAQSEFQSREIKLW